MRHPHIREGLADAVQGGLVRRLSAKGDLLQRQLARIGNHQE